MRALAYPGDRRIWGVLALLAVFFLHAERYVSAQRQLPTEAYGDGYYTWVFARSLAFDGDLELKNDYELCGDPFKLGADEGGGRPANPFYFGPALAYAPTLWIVRHVVKLRPDAPPDWKNACRGPLVGYVGFLVPIAVFLTMAVAYRVARRWYDEIPCAIAVMVIALGSTLNVFGGLSWYYSHVWAALVAAVAILCAIRAYERPERRLRWLGVGLACGVAALVRVQEAAWLLVPFVAIASHLRTELAVSRRKALLTATWRSLAILVPFAAVYAVQLAIYRYLYGAMFVVPQGKLYIQLGHAHPFLVLFSARCGLLYWTPLIWLSVLGVPLFLLDRSRRAIAGAIVATAMIEFYVGSSAIPWTGGAAMGARIATSLVPVFVVTAAPTVAALIRWAARRRLKARSVVILALFPWVAITWGIPLSNPSNGAPVPGPRLYSGGLGSTLASVYGGLGNPWTLPATAVFAARYRVAPKVFDIVAADGMFHKHYRTAVSEGDDTLVFATPATAYWAEGFVKIAPEKVPEKPAEKLPSDKAKDAKEPAKDAKEPAKEPPKEPPPRVVLRKDTAARFLLALYWPWVTHVIIKAKTLTDGPATLQLRAAGFFFERDVGRATFTGTQEQAVELEVAGGVFDSGINEVLLRADKDLVLVSIQFLDRGVRDGSIRVFK